MVRKTVRKEVPVYPVVKSRGGDTYELQEILFRGIPNPRNRWKQSNPHASTRVDWHLALEELYDGKVPNLRCYSDSARIPHVRQVTRNSYGGLTVGCNTFSRTTMIRIARWAGFSKWKTEIMFPKAE